MIKRSSAIDIKDETSNAVHCTKGMARASDFLRKKKKGGGGGNFILKKSIQLVIGSFCGKFKLNIFQFARAS